MYFWNRTSIVEYFQKYSCGYERRPYVTYIYIYIYTYCNIDIQVAVLDFGLGVIRVNHPVKVSNPEGASQPAHKRYSAHLNGTDSHGVFVLMRRNVSFTFQDTLLIFTFSDYIHMYIYTSIHLYIYASIHTYIYTSIHKHTHIYIYIYTVYTYDMS